MCGPGDKEDIGDKAATHVQLLFETLRFHVLMNCAGVAGGELVVQLLEKKPPLKGKREMSKFDDANVVTPPPKMTPVIEPMIERLAALDSDGGLIVYPDETTVAQALKENALLSDPESPSRLVILRCVIVGEVMPFTCSVVFTDGVDKFAK